MVEKRKAHFSVILCHWSMVALLVCSLLTGMRIGWGVIDSPLGGPGGVWSTMLHALGPKGTLFGVNVITLHITCAWLLLVNAGIYMSYLFRSGASRRLRLTRQDFRALTRAMGAFTYQRDGKPTCKIAQMFADGLVAVCHQRTCF